MGNPTNKGGGDFALRRQIGCDGVKWGGRAGAVANSPALMVESSTVALGESCSVGEHSATPIEQQLSSAMSFHVVPADCSGRRWLHQSIIIFACAASRCLESAVVVYRSHLRRSGTVDPRLKMIIFTSCPNGPVTTSNFDASISYTLRYSIKGKMCFL